MERLPLPQCPQRTQRQGGWERRPLARASSRRAPPRPEVLPASPAEKHPKLERKKLHRAEVGGQPRPRGRSRRGGDRRCPRTRRPREPRLTPPGPRLGEGREARSRRFPAEGQQQLRRNAAGEGGTQPLPPARPQAEPGPPAPPALHPAPPPRPRKERASRGGQPLPPSREMPQPRLLARSLGPTAPAAGTHLRLRRPGRPGRAPGRCVRLRPPGKVPTAPGASGRGPEQRRKRRQQREQPTSGAAHPELLPDPLPSRPRRRPRLPRRLCATGTASAASLPFADKAAATRAGSLRWDK